MKPLYLTPTIRKDLGPCLRPGGEFLTKRAIGFLGDNLGDVIVDAGCGAGGSLSILSSAAGRLVGLDLEMQLLSEAKKYGHPLLQADLARIPLGTGTVDTLFCECVWNLTSKKEVLSEFKRIIRPDGHLVLSDIYLREQMGEQDPEEWPVRSCFSYATTLQAVRDMVEAGGFQIERIEDHLHLFKQTAAEFVFSHGSLQAFWTAVLGSAEMAAKACTVSAKTKPSLFLLIARRSA